MTVTLAKEKEVTAITIKADSRSPVPPPSQILRALCYKAVCCSVNKGLIKPSVTAVLGTIQIMVGLFHVALGPGRPPLHPWDLTDIGASYWLGAVYTAAGITSVLAGQFPSQCLVIVTVIVNIVSAAFAFTGIVLFSIELQEINMGNMRPWAFYNYSDPSLDRLLANVDAVSFMLAVLQLCVSAGVAGVGIKAVINMRKKEAGQHVGDQQPESEIFLTSPCA
ncbi:membrane-spanning 4-domains subfamily A member 8-like [Paralichthys olivaceus]|uniref:membrane-spanning 4-domains subfamily A member 8-like n=1 Tax=Paralichthys olivaceus TaxID=8255 RepID=UPI003753BC52